MTRKTTKQLYSEWVESPCTGNINTKAAWEAAQTISGMVVWSETTEGSEFWEAIQNRLIKMSGHSNGGAST